MNLKRKVEAVLFAAGKSISLSEIAKLVKAPETIVEEALNELKKQYSAESESSLILENEGKSWRLTIKQEHFDTVKDLVPTTELPKAVTETLAVIAYKQPVMQSTIIKIRGNKAYDHIEKLENAELIQKEKKGRSFIIKITPKFLEYFELPKKESTEVKDVLEEKLKEKGVEVKLEVYETNEEEKVIEGEKLGKLDIYDLETEEEKNTEKKETEEGQESKKTIKSPEEKIENPTKTNEDENQ